MKATASSQAGLTGIPAASRYMTPDAAATALLERSSQSSPPRTSRPAGLELGHRYVDVLARVNSARAKDYVREFNAALAPWSRESAVRNFLHRARTELGIAA